MRRKLIWTAVVAIPLSVAGLLYGQTLVPRHAEKPQQAEAFVCPLTGEELPCPNCCPLKQQK